jgi:xylonate dehydratase
MALSPEAYAILSNDSQKVYDIRSSAPGPAGELPLTEEFLINAPSGDVFGWSQNVGMGWDPSRLKGKEILLLGTQGGIRAEDGTPLALGFHTGHWEIGLLMREAALELQKLGCIPFAGFVSDPCDGRTQGTPGMMDSLPYRNDAAAVLRRLIRSLPTRHGVLGAATCDKGLPAMMMALASMRDLPCLLMPGGVTLPPTTGEDLGTIQSIGARYAQGEITLDYAREMSCRTCASPGGGCQFLGTAATSQVVAEALGLVLPHSALAPSGQEIWLDMARRSASALVLLESRGLRSRDLITPAALRNAMTVHAAFGGSTNLLLHVPAIAHAAGIPRPTVSDWIEVNRRVPRMVDVLPNGPVGHPTVRVFLSGGVPEVMLHLRNLELLELDALTAIGEPLGTVLDWWEGSERRTRVRDLLQKRDAIDPDDVIMPPAKARRRGLTSTVTFPTGNLAPHGSVVKSTAIDPSVMDSGVYRKTGPAQVFTREPDAIKAVKNGTVSPGDVLILMCAGPKGSGMEEILQVTGALKHLPWGKEVAVITDARFSGVSTGACIGHVGPEALAGGPIGKVRTGDIIRIEIDTIRLEGRVDLVGEAGTGAGELSLEAGNAILSSRAPLNELRARKDLPDDTRLWAALQEVGGGTWGGCIYDVDRIIECLSEGKKRIQELQGEED